MNDKHWITECIDAGDGSGDVIVELPTELLESMGLRIGNELTLEMISGSIVLKPIRSTPSA